MKITISPKEYEAKKHELEVRFQTTGITGREFMKLAEMQHMQIPKSLWITFNKKVELIGSTCAKIKPIRSALCYSVIQLADTMKQKIQA